MAIFRMLLVFMLILCIAPATAFMGYRYLSLASEYRERNLLHFRTTESAFRSLTSTERVAPNLYPILLERIEQARAQALWCTENLSPLETRMFSLLGAGTGLDICERNAATLSQAADLLMNVPMGAHPTYVDKLRLRRLLEESRSHSTIFQPYVTRMETGIRRIVTSVTAANALLSLVLFWILSRRHLAGYRLVRRQRAELRQSSSRLREAIEASGEGVALYDAEERLVIANDIYRRTVHPDPDRVRPGVKGSQIASEAIAQGFYHDPERYQAMIARSLESPNVLGEDAEVITSQGRHVRLRMRKTDFGDTVVTRSDVTDYVETARRLEEAYREIERVALTDALTGLPNRRRFDECLAGLQGQPHGPILRIDLDRFKQVNDVLGHEAGDFVLCHVADILRGVVGDSGLAARIGGDEFVVLCDPGTMLDQAKSMAAAILAEIGKPLRYEGRLCLFGASFGIAAPEPDDPTPATTLRNADVALYKAKDEGRGRITLFTPDLRQASERIRRLADAMPDALGNGEFVPYFQSQHDAKSRRLTGAEALARWEHPDFGTLSPAEFLPVAQQLGLEAEIDHAILGAGLAALDRFDAAGLSLRTLSFNASTGRLMDPEFLHCIDGLHVPDPGRIAIEILETVSVEAQGPALLLVLDALRERGFRVDIDDFGSDHASVNSLLRTRPDAVKLDRALSSLAAANGDSARTVAAVVDLARSLDLTVIAEGIETAAHADVLAEIGCNVLQGYHFSRPMPEAAFLASFGPERSQSLRG